ncbi:TetR/AcrR family transcriptional regulator [Methanobacterium aggregans]|uniref:TetR/AcrR family transcriptional regulator n=1 Tax=Methanobacterium aggregans TaxID=1615586 RepID=UPI001AE841DA|nr:TetR/AcrR family transcriptional regulator [Methanobacterium aggregans]MBP2046390.1 AcrR family transcriptional regulator [Methanobacterium aggregans]
MNKTLDEDGKISTKEKIFQVSVDLFSEKGFNAVSIREIAREVGIRESSIYNHYKNKEAILDTIIEYFMEVMGSSGPPEDVGTEMLTQSPEAFLKLGASMYMDQINTPTMNKIWRIISIEMYQNERIRHIFLESMLEEPLKFWESIFTQLIHNKLIKPFDPKILAREYFFFGVHLFFEYFVLRYHDTEESFIDAAKDRLMEHIDFLLAVITPEVEK